MHSPSFDTPLCRGVRGYDVEGRLAQCTQTFAGREGYPLVKNYVMDSLDRVKELYYPAQYGGSGVSKKIEMTYDIASRIDSLKFDGTTFASNPVYNASSQVESLNVGSFKQDTTRPVDWPMCATTATSRWRPTATGRRTSD